MDDESVASSGSARFFRELTQYLSASPARDDEGGIYHEGVI